MTAAWPNTLPQYVQISGYSESPPDNKIESQTDSGAVKTRQRFTTAWRPIAGEIICANATQLAAFETFYNDTLASGSLPFTWVNPLTQGAATFQFRKPAPSYRPLGGDATAVRFSLWQRG